jgi:hypothetical protein
MMERGARQAIGADRVSPLTFSCPAVGRAWLTVERALTRFGDIEPCDIDRLPAFDHALSGRRRKPEFDQIPQLVARKAMHEHDRFGAARSAAASKQHKRAALMGLGATTTGNQHVGLRELALRRNRALSGPLAV